MNWGGGEGTERGLLLLRGLYVMLVLLDIQ